MDSERVHTTTQSMRKSVITLAPFKSRAQDMDVVKKVSGGFFPASVVVCLFSLALSAALPCLP